MSRLECFDIEKLNFLLKYFVIHAFKTYSVQYSSISLQKGKLSFVGKCLLNQPCNCVNSKIITTNRLYDECLCLEAWHINSAQFSLSRGDGVLLPDSVYTSLIKINAN